MADDWAFDPTRGTGVEEPFDLAAPKQRTGAAQAVNYVDPETETVSKTDDPDDFLAEVLEKAKDQPVWNPDMVAPRVREFFEDAVEQPSEAPSPAFRKYEVPDFIERDLMEASDLGLPFENAVEQASSEPSPSLDAAPANDQLLAITLQQVALMRQELAMLGEHLGAFPDFYATQVQRDLAPIFGGESA